LIFCEARQVASPLSINGYGAKNSAFFYATTRISNTQTEISFLKFIFLLFLTISTGFPTHRTVADQKISFRRAEVGAPVVDYVDGFASLPEEVFSIVAGFISKNAGINVVEPSQSAWFRLRSLNRSMSTRATFQLVLKYIEKHQTVINECATTITNLMSKAVPNEIARIEQYSNKLYDLRRRSEMIEAALSRFKRRQSLLAASKFDAILSDDEREAFLNEDELSELLIISSRVLANAQQFKQSIQPSDSWAGTGTYPRQPNVQPWPAPQPPAPWAPQPPQPFPAYPGEPDPDFERIPGFNEDDFDRDLNPFPDPFAPPQFPGQPGRGGPRPGLPKQPGPRFDPFNPLGPGPNNPFGGPRGGGGGGGGVPRFL
jgi:hypothetical protein